jgi:hypothetical protein
MANPKVTVTIDADVKKIESKIKNAETRVNNAANSMKRATNITPKLNDDLMKKKLSELKKLHSGLKAKLEKQIKMDVSAGELQNTRTEIKAVESALGGLDTATGEASKDFKTMAMSFASSIGIAVAAIGVLKKALDFTRDSVKTASNFQQIQTRLENMYGEVEKATQVFESFRDVAATTPFQFQDVAQAGATLKAFGLDAEETLKSAADLAAFMGTDIVEAANSMGRAFAGGAGAADILRERGILNLIKEFKGIDDLTKLTLPEFRKAMLETFVDPTAGIAGATDKLSKTYAGAISNMQDAIDGLKNAIGSGLLPVLTDMARGLTDIVYAITPVETQLDKANQKAAEQRMQFETLINTYERLRDQTDKNDVQLKLYNETIETIQKTYPDYLGNIGDETQSREDLEKAIKNQRKAIIDLAKVQAAAGMIQDLQAEQIKEQVKQEEKEVELSELTAKFGKKQLEQNADILDLTTSTVDEGQKLSKEAQKIIKAQEDYKNLNIDIINSQNKQLEIQTEIDKIVNATPEAMQKIIDGQKEVTTATAGTISEYQKWLKEINAAAKEQEKLKEFEIRFITESGDLAGLISTLATFDNLTTDKAFNVLANFLEQNPEQTENFINDIEKIKGFSEAEVYEVKARIAIETGSEMPAIGTPDMPEIEGIEFDDVTFQIVPELDPAAEKAYFEGLTELETAWKDFNGIAKSSQTQTWQDIETGIKQKFSAIREVFQKNGESIVELNQLEKEMLSEQQAEYFESEAMKWQNNFNLVSGFLNNIFGLQQQNLNKRHKKEVDRLNKQKKIELSKAKNTEERTKIEAKYESQLLAVEKKKEQEEKKIAQRKKIVSIAESIINTAVGVAKALSMANIPLSITIGALGAVQTAMIAAQPLKQGAIDLQGGSQGVDSIPAMLTPGESVMTEQETRRFKPQLQLMRTNPDLAERAFSGLTVNREMSNNVNQNINLEMAETNRILQKLVALQRASSIRSIKNTALTPATQPIAINIDGKELIRINETNKNIVTNQGESFEFSR